MLCKYITTANTFHASRNKKFFFWKRVPFNVIDTE